MLRSFCFWIQRETPLFLSIFLCKIESWYSNIEIIRILMYEIQRDKNVHACTDYGCIRSLHNYRRKSSRNFVMEKDHRRILSQKKSWNFIVEEDHHGILSQKRIIAVFHRRKKSTWDFLAEEDSSQNFVAEEDHRGTLL